MRTIISSSLMPADVIPYEDLGAVNAQYRAALDAAAKEVLDSGWYILGKQVPAFETAFASYCGVQHCIGVGNGMDALILALEALQLPAGSEVLVPSNTYIASILAIVRAGLKPVLVEPDEATYNIDPALLEQHISTNTKAILVVHLYGKCADMDAIHAVAKAYQLYVLEDAAQAHGAMYKNVKAGNLSDIAAFSFYPSKNLGAIGDAGAVCTNDAVLAERVRLLRNYGSSKKYHNELPGTNSRLDELQAAFLLAKLPGLDALVAHKRMLASIYHELLSNAVQKPVVHPDYFDAYHIYPIRVAKRNELKQFLLERGIGSEIHYPIAPVQQVAMKEILQTQHSPIAIDIHETILSLPISYCHTPEQIEKVAAAVNSFVKLHQ